ncbi:MAG: NUDIX hydrolase [Porphyromonadaceae bacterium]|nr:NUDIX hydrolase [Porphyromonadaceae bacterium]
MEEKTKAVRPWEVLESRYLSKKPWFTVREEHVRLPNGNELPHYYVFEYPNWINVIAITTEGKYVFERQYRHALGVVSYELCAGVCEAVDGSPLESARRELLEETGYGNGEWEELMVLSPNPGTHTNLTYCYLARNVERVEAPHLEPTEDIAVDLLSLDEVRALLDRNGVIQALHAAPLWKHISMLK